METNPNGLSLNRPGFTSPSPPLSLFGARRALRAENDIAALTSNKRDFFPAQAYKTWLRIGLTLRIPSY
jgi:hypothetical protein